MNFLEVVKQAKKLFSLVKFSQEQLVNNMLIEYDGEEISQSSVIYLVSPDGEKSPLPDEQYVTKSGTIFIITDGAVSSVEQKGQSKQESKEPIKQAQSKESPIESNPNPMSDKKEEVIAEDKPVEAPKEEPKESPSIGEQITAALAPVLEAINQVKESLKGTEDMAKSTKEDLSKVQQTVEKLAAQPADIPKETKEIKNPFSSTSSDLKETRAYQIFNSIKKP